MSKSSQFTTSSLNCAFIIFFRSLAEAVSMLRSVKVLGFLGIPLVIAFSNNLSIVDLGVFSPVCYVTLQLLVPRGVTTTYLMGLRLWSHLAHG